MFFDRVRRRRRRRRMPAWAFNAWLAAALVLAPAAFVASVQAQPQGRDSVLAQTSPIGTRDDADPTFQTVVGAMAALDPKPVHPLSPEEARQQPTLAEPVLSGLP